MSQTDDMREYIADLRQRAAGERRRAASAAAAAARWEQEAASPPASLTPDRLKLAAVYRRIGACHRASAQLHDLRATRLQARLDQAGGTALRPVFMATAAAAMGMSSAAVVLLGQQRAAAMLATSDAIARAAHDLEYVLGEGPVHAVIAEAATVRVAASAMHDRWPRYGPAVTGLGVQAVLAVPLLPAGGLGALCGYGRRPAITGDAAAAARRIAAALARTLLKVAPPRRPGEGVSALPLFGETDDQAVVHQAAGMVSAHRGCNISDALALLRARAFASGQPVGELAHCVVDNGLRLD